MRGTATVFGDVGGAVSILGAFVLFLVIILAALAIEMAQGYQTRIAYQGAADVAALAAANAYVASGSDTTMTATAQDIARANGIPVANLTVTHLTNYSASVSDAVRVVFTRQVPLVFARVFTRSASYTVSVQAVASMSSNSAPACIIGLSSSAGGVTMTGGTRLSAPSCAVSTNDEITMTGGVAMNALGANSSNAIRLTGGSSLTATNIVYGTTLSGTPGTTIAGTTAQRANSIPDPLASHAGLASAFANLGTYTTPQTTSVPTGSDLSLGWYPTTMTFAGHTGTLSGGVWTFPAGTYNIRNLNTGSTRLVILGPSTVTVSGSVTIGGGGGLTIGDGPVAFAGPVSLSGGTTMTLGAGRHYMGAVSVGGGGVLTIGDGDLDINGDLQVSGGGSTVRIGAGAITVGQGSANRSIQLSGGSVLTMGDGAFSANGSVKTAGGSSITFGATGTHYINGDLDLNGSAVFGAGTYLIDGNFTNNTGGTMTGTDVSFVIAGTIRAEGGTSINLAAPTSGSFADIVFATRSSGATRLGGGSQDVFSGIVYAPASDVTLSGGANASGLCFSLIGASVTLNGGTSIATACPSISGTTASSGSVSLLQ